MTDQLETLLAGMSMFLSREPGDVLLHAIGGDDSLASSMKEYILKHPAQHVMSLKDEEYLNMLQEAQITGRRSRWKGRARDFKGQFFRTKFEDGVMQGWSLRQHKYVLVVPWSFGQILKMFCDNFNEHLVKHDPSRRARLCAHHTELERNYDATAGQRAEGRSLNDRPHRQLLNGRRNHFVAVPKPI